MLFDGEVTSLSGPKRKMAQSYTEHKGHYKRECERKNENFKE
jgi:hypothetical protein